MTADEDRTRRMLAEIQALAHLGIWEWDVASATLTWSEELYQILGLAPAEVPARFDDFLSRVHPEDLPSVRAYHSRARRDRSPSALDYRIVRPSGEIRMVQGRARGTFDEHGTLVRLIGTDQDVTGTRQITPRVVPRARVLIVDDDVMFASSLRRLLASEHEVSVSNAGAAALARLQAGEVFDAILCAMMMPGLTGAELHAALCEVDRGLADRIIFITGGAFSPAAQRFLERVTNPCFEKPCDIDQLRDAVRRRVAVHRP